MREEADRRHLVLDRRGQRRRHVAVLVEVDVLEPELAQLLLEQAEEVPLLRGRGEDVLVLEARGVDAHVADEAVAGLRRELVREVGAVALGRHRGVRLASAACTRSRCSSSSPRSGASRSSRSRTRWRSTRCSRSSPCGSRSRRATLAVPGRRRLGSLGRDGWRAGVVLGLLLAAGLRAPDRRARAHDRLQHRLHHRPLRRLHADSRRAPLRCTVGAAAWVGVALSTVGLALLSGIDAGSPRRRPARARRVARLLAPDRADGARRAPLRRRWR